MEARSLGLPVRRQEELLLHPVLGVRRLMAENRSLVPALQERVVLEGLGSVEGWFLSRNPRIVPSLRQHVVSTFADGNHFALRSYVVNPTCEASAQLLAFTSFSEDSPYRGDVEVSLLENPGLCEEVQLLFARDARRGVLSLLAEHPALALSTQARIVEDTSWESWDVLDFRTVGVLARNRSAHESILREIYLRAIDERCVLGRLVVQSLVQSPVLPDSVATGLTFTHPGSCPQAWSPNLQMSARHVVEHHAGFVRASARAARVAAGDVFDLAPGWQGSLGHLLEAVRLTGGLVAS